MLGFYEESQLCMLCFLTQESLQDGELIFYFFLHKILCLQFDQLSITFSQANGLMFVWIVWSKLCTQQMD